MRAITGTFARFTNAARAAGQLGRLLDDDRVCLLTPESPPEEALEVPKTEDMPPVGGAMGATLGGALGVSLAIAVPGVGPVTALGTAAIALLLGIGGAAAGWKLGDFADRAGSSGVPVDELYVYEDALRIGRSVLVALVADEEKEDEVRAIMAQNGAESLDAARERWWLGLRDAEQAHYDAHGADFRDDEAAYRQGMQAALSPRLRGKSLNEARSLLGERAPDDADETAFRRGFESGQSYWRARQGLGTGDEGRDSSRI